MSSQLMSSGNRNRRSVGFVSRHYFRERISHAIRNSSTRIDTKNHGHTFVKSLKWATMVNLPVLMMSFCSIFWLPTIVSNDDLRTTLEENHINKSNYGQCSTYSFGHKLYTLISDCFLAMHTVFIIWVCLVLNMFLHYSPNGHLTNYLNSFHTLAGFAVICISAKINNAFTCRPFNILLDIRFISILITQLIGFIGCLSFAHKLGWIFANKRPMKISQN